MTWVWQERARLCVLPCQNRAEGPEKQRGLRGFPHIPPRHRGSAVKWRRAVGPHVEGLPTNTERRVLRMVLGGPAASRFLLDGGGQELLFLDHLLFCDRWRFCDVAQVGNVPRVVNS